MVVYKSNPFVIIKNLVFAAFGGLLAAMIAGWFLGTTIAVVIGAAIALYVTYCVLFRDNFKIVADDGVLSFYRRENLAYRFIINDVGFHANIRTSMGDSDCTLTVTEPDGSVTRIDCTTIGEGPFYELLDLLKVTDPEPNAIETKKKNV